jgi:hypothetical protein
VNRADIVKQLKEKKDLFNYKTSQLEEAVEEKLALEEEKKTHETLKQTYENLVFTCKLILEELTNSSKAQLENFLTYALQNIFIDRNYEVKLVLKEDTKKPGLELTLVEDGIEQEITDAVGGGILSTLGLLLQIYYIEVYDLNRTMFIDEGLKEVSTGNTISADKDLPINYLKNILKFLKWLSDEKDYRFIIVTHDNQVREFADYIYEVKKGEVKLCY